MRRKLIAGNWKMYKDLAETQAFVRSVAAESQKMSHADLAIFAQAPLLPALLQEVVASSARLSCGPQNIYWEPKGAFTGELSPVLAQELGCTFALAGHSERRQLFGETIESAAKRALAAHQYGMQAVFCVGEQLSEREAEQTFAVLQAQCAPLFAQAPTMPDGFVFAYEPVWAIGTGRTASAAQAQEVHAFLRKEIATHWGEGAAAQCKILYGGSVKPENAKELLSQIDIDGVLIGGASLEPSSFLTIAASCKE